MSETDDTIRSQMMQSRCNGCNEVFPKHRRADCCSGCQIACYCSQDCQRKHWKEHKATCVRDKERIITLKSEGHGRLHRLIRQFHNQVNATSFYSAAVQYAFQNNEHCHSLLQQPPTKLACLTLAFDYHQKSFYARGTSLLDVPECVSNRLGGSYRGGGPLQHWLQVYVEHVGMIYELAVTIPRSHLVNDSSQHIFDISHLCRLTSSIFELWNTTLEKILATAFDSLTSQQEFLTFAMHALACKCESPMHKTHVIVLLCILKHALGEIRSLNYYHVVHIEDVFNMVNVVPPLQIIDPHRILQQEVELNDDIQFRVVFLDSFVATAHSFDATAFLNEEKARDATKEGSYSRRRNNKKKRNKKFEKKAFTRVDSEAEAARIFREKVIQLRDFPAGELPTIG